MAAEIGYVRAIDFGYELMVIMGMPEDWEVSRVVMDCTCRSLAQVQITRIISPTEAEQIKKLVHKYTLIETKEPDAQ